jgi:methyl-accepting chemotaxis protein
MHLSGYTFNLIPVTPAEDLTFRFIVLCGLTVVVMGFTLLYEGLKNNAFKRSKLSFEQLKTAFSEITDNAEILALSATELTSASEAIEKNASDSMEEISQMVEGTTEANQNIHTLASSIEQITGGVQDISKSTGEAADVSKNAVTLVDSINKMVAKLDENNKEIGQMTTLITDIAFQTNLLALNAAIEAARAGDAGRGFAVVAGAVRTLSLEASEAANKISDKIKAVQEDTESAIDTIRRVNETIYKFNDLMNYIASAIAEQTGTLTEMSQHAGKAADETSRIAESSQSVSRAAESTSNGINEVLEAAKELSHMAETLRGLTQQTT